MNYDDLPQSYRDDIEARFKGEPESLVAHAEMILGDIDEGCDIPVQHYDMDTLCFINGKAAHHFRLHFVHHSEDAYYDQWMDLHPDRHICGFDDELAERWNWCVHNLTGAWSVHPERQHQCQVVYNLAIAEDEDALRFMAKWGAA